ncbi:MAG: peptidyl-prolyl cis-trans isomerase [candidate division WOR-3 bacterium]
MRLTTLLLLAGLLGFGCAPKNGRGVVALVNGIPITLAELERQMPQTVPAQEESTIRRKTLEELIAKELFVQEAERQGLDSAIGYQLELEKKALVMRELFRTIAQQVRPVSELELKRDYELLKTEDRCQVIVVPDRTQAQRLIAELEMGVPFESLAVRHSIHPSRVEGGDMGYTPELYIDEPLRSAVIALTPGAWTQPILYDSNYAIIRLIDRRPADPPPPPFSELKQRLAEQLKLTRQRQAAANYMAELRRRLEFNPEGLRVFYKPVDSITESEKEIWVAIRDGRQYVKVGRLLHIGRRFPPYLDTAIRSYAIRRAIEEDIAYEDGLNRGLDKAPRVRAELAETRRRLLYDKFYEREVASQVTVSDSEVAAYYEAHRDRFLGELASVATLIRNDLTKERRTARYNEVLSRLRDKARIVVNERVLHRAQRRKEKK